MMNNHSTDHGSEYDNTIHSVGRIGNWMQTYTGIQFWPLDPRPDEIDIIDIAHALSMCCRYGGHCDQFYSVAEHSYHMSYIVPEEYALYGLLHDATEAYLVDIPRPIKSHLSQYKNIENNLWKIIAEKYNLSIEVPDIVKDLDSRILLAEKEQNMKEEAALWMIEGDVPDVTLNFWLPTVAKEKFITRFNELI